MIVRTRRLLLCLLIVAAAGACTRASEPTATVPGTPPPSLALAAPFLVSNPVAGPAEARVGSAAEALIDERVYIAAPSGTYPDFVSASVRVARTGFTALANLIDGGLDPVAVPARRGDTITVQLRRDAGAPVTYQMLVPRNRAPVIVRTVPPRSKRDVPLNTRVLVVFSEPIDPNSLTAQSVSLRAGNVIVPGTLTFATPDQTTAEFVPSSSLRGSTDYELVITQTITDREGSVLEAPAQVPFTTEDARPAELVMTVNVTGVEFAPPGFSISVDGGAPLAVGVGTNTIVASLESGAHSVAFRGLNVHCAVDGPATRSVVVVFGRPIPPMGWNITCARTAPRQLAFVREGEIYLASTDGTEVVRLTTPQAGVFNSDPAWSPDGSRIAFTRSGSDEFDVWVQDVYVMNADGSNPVRLTGEHANNTSPTWSPDGQSVVFSAFSRVSGSADLYLTSATVPGGATRLTTSPGWEAYPEWSPDGSRIVFSSDWRAYDFLSDLYIMGSDGSGARALIVGPFAWVDTLRFHSHPAWSPSGQQIAFIVCGYSRGSTCNVAVANADGTGVTTVARATEIAKPAWSRDGRILAFTQAASIRFVRLDGTGEGVLISSGHSPAFRP